MGCIKKFEYYIDTYDIDDTLIYVLLYNFSASNISYELAKGSVNSDSWDIYMCNGLFGITEFIIKDGIFYVGNGNGNVLRSEDSGKNWINTSGGLATGYSSYCNSYNSIRELYSDGSTLFAGTHCYGIYKLSGTHWSQINNGIPMETRTSADKLSGNQDKIFALTQKGVYYSYDSGNFWNLDDRLPHYSFNMDVEANDNNVGIISQDLFYKSNNNGLDWETINYPSYLIGCHYFRTDITSDSSSYYIVDDACLGMLKLPFTDTVFKPASYGLTQKRAIHLYKSDSILFSSHITGGLYYSDTTGTNWRTKENLLVGKVVNSLIDFDTIIVAATTQGVYYSNNNGLEWITNDNSINLNKVNTVIAFNNKLYAGTDSGVFKANYDFTIWEAMNNGLNNSIYYLYSYAGLLYGCSNNGLFLFDQSSESWNKIEGPFEGDVYSVLRTPKYFFVGNYNDIFYSNDNGLTWENQSFNEEVIVNFLTTSDTNVFAATSVGIFYFNQEANTWINLNLDLGTKHLLISDSLIYAANDAGIFKAQITEAFLTDINYNTSAENLKIYPNPFDSHLTIKIEKSSILETQINIYNINGILVYSKELKTNSSSTHLIEDLSYLNEGLYFLQLILDKKSITRKVYKSKNK